jgi:Protein of unknown function (DUF2510)
MYYGHASWIALLVFGATFLLRALSRRRRRGPGGTRMAGRSLSGGGPRGAAGGRTASSSAGVPDSTGTPPGWFTDPFLKHQQRYWSGSGWTEHVTDDGIPGTDPPPVPPDLRDAG